MTKVYTICLLAFTVFLGAGKLAAQTPMFSKANGTGTQTIPLNQDAQKTQILYPPSDFTPSPSSGQITKVYFRVHSSGASSTTTYTNFKVSFAQADYSIVPNSSYINDLFVALYEPSFSITTGVQGTWFEIPLTIPFNYDNTKSLIVEIEYSAKSGGISTYSISAGTGNNRRISGQVLNAATGSLQATVNDFGFDVSPSASCSASPLPGTVMAGSNTLICPGDSVKLFTLNSSGGTGIMYTWESASSATGPWSTVAPAETNNAYTAKPSVSTYYRAGISCNGGVYQYTPEILISTRQPLNGNYTIDVNAPATDLVTGGTTFKSFADVQTYLNCNPIAGPVTFNVVNGVYTDQLTIGSHPHPIVINGNGATLQFAAVTGSRHLIRLDGAKHVTVRDIILKSTATGFGWGVHFSNGADSNRITQCVIDLNTVTSTTQGPSAGIVASNGTSAVTTAGNTGSYNIIDSNEIKGGYQGIVMYGNADGTGSIKNRIFDNIIKDFHTTGIELGNTDSIVIEKNDISRTSRPGTTVGTFAGIQLNAGNKKAVIAANSIHETHPASILTGSTYGIYFNNCDASVGEENLVYNNILYRFNGSTGLIYALYNLNSNGVKYYHNSIALDNTSSTAGVATRGFFQSGEASNITFQNNNIVITRGGTGPKAVLYFDNASSAITSNYNNLYISAPGSNNFVGFNVATGYASIALWKSNTSYDANSRSVDPLLSNTTNGDLKPNENALNNAGSFVGVTHDFLDVLRNTSTPDIGAFEFDAGPCTNPPTTGGEAIISVSPSSICPGSSVTLDLQNIVPGAGQTYTWQSSATSGSGFTNIATASANTDITISPTSSLYYRAILTCGTGSATSAEVQVVVKQPLAGNTYTINPAGAGPLNFASFGAVVNAIGCGVTSSTVFNVAAETFDEQVILPGMPGMSASNTITFKGTTGSILRFNSTNTNERATLKLNGAKYVTVDSLEIIAAGNADTEYGFGVHFVNDADNNTISNCIITVATNPVTASSNRFAGLVISGSGSSATALGSNCDNNIIQKNTITGGAYGIAVFGSNSPASLIDGNSITANTIRDFYEYGMYSSGTKNLLFEKNDISRPVRTNGGAFRGIFLTGLHENGRISKNKIHDPFAGNLAATQNATGIYTEASAGTGNENIISNNLIYDFKNAGPQVGINDNGSTNIKYYHNTISLDDIASASGGAANATWGIILGTSSSTGIDIKNNIISITRNGTNWGRHGIRLISNSVGFTSNNNVIHVVATGGGTAAVGYIGSTAYNTLADWQAIISQDLNSKSLDPLYANLNAGDLTPTESQINNIGANVGITTDINDVTRTTTPDPGAIEFGNSLCNVPPVAGTSILTPLTEVCPGTPITLNLTGHDIGSGISYQWQASSTLNGTYTGVSGSLTNPEYNFNAPAATLYYRAAVTCSGNTTYSDTVMLDVAELRSGTFTINPDLSANADFISIGDAVNYIRCGVNGPVTFNIAQGAIFNEQVVIPAIPGTSVTNRILFNGNGASVISNPSIAAPVGFTLDGADHVILDSLIIDVSQGSRGYALLLTNQADSNIIRKCTIKTAISTSISHMGIYINGSGSSTSVAGNNGNGNLITGNTVIGGYYGISMYGGGVAGDPNYNNSIINNTVLDAYTAPIYISFQRGAVIRGNDLSRPTRTTSQSTVYGIALWSNNDSTTIEANRIHNMFDAVFHDQPFYAIFINSSIASAGKENNIFNNLVYNVNHDGLTNGIRAEAASFTNIYHNTFVLDGGTGLPAGTYGFYHTGTGSNINFKNNIIYITRGSNADKFGIYKNNAAAGITSNNNVIYLNTGGNDYIGYQSTPRQTLADWQSTGQDLLSKSDDPVFNDPAQADFKPTTQAVDNIGTPLGISNDIVGVTRSATTPDAGAFEFSIVLPVTLIDFRGEQSGATNKLTWSTSTEINNKGFELQRSADGRNFTSIAFIATTAEGGNSSTGIGYSYNDVRPLAHSYYRLKQIDRDGKINFSKVILLTKKVSEITFSSIYPNPVRNELNVTIASPLPNNVTLLVTDLTGKAVMQQQTRLIAGMNHELLHVGYLSAGTYFIKAVCSTGCEKAVQRFVKQ